MTYRDRQPKCPRCEVDLVRRLRRDIWRCPQCLGVQLAIDEVEYRLRLLAPAISDGVVRDVMTFTPNSSAHAIACPMCGNPMQPEWLGGVEVDRCARDLVVWFDPTELDRVMEVADEQHEAGKSWIARLLSRLYVS